MDSLQWTEAIFTATQIAFAFAFGACAGSLINVLVYRMPLGISVVTPPSRCPSCGTQLTWRENLPIIGWVLLRGRCRFCKSRISPEYPIVEAFVAVLFAAMYVLWYVVPPFGFAWEHSAQAHGTFLGIPWGSIKPAWAYGGFRESWPLFVNMVVLLGCLTAMTLTDAKTCTIPLPLTWWPAIAAVVAHPAWAWYLQQSVTARNPKATQYLTRVAEGWWWAIPTPGPHGWVVIGASIGGVVGVGLANLLLHVGVFHRSFADYDEWEKSVAAAGGGAGPTGPGNAGETPVPPPMESAAEGSPTDLWIQYPHARREMLRELIFLSPVVSLAMIGAWVADRFAGPWKYNAVTFQSESAHAAPLWLMALAGVLMGYLIGGGVVWVFRIAGSLGIGKEAMGLGDVHLLAAVGAAVGWINAVLAFFAAAFVGLVHALLGGIFRGKLRQAMPFGPYLAIGTLLVLVARPLVELLLARIFHVDRVELP